jgi:polyhydroxybutyrate depolymerase
MKRRKHPNWRLNAVLVLLAVATLTCGRGGQTGGEDGTSVPSGDPRQTLQPPPATTQPCSEDQSLTYDGLERSYCLYVPSSYDPLRPMPMVLVLHGGGGDNRYQERSMRSGFHPLAERDGALVVYPNGVEERWNDGRDIDTWRAHRDDIDDVGFISALIDHLAGKYSLDLSRVYATGISNGGMMSFRLACELSDRIAAIAPVAANMPYPLSETCAPSRPVPLLMIKGSEDSLSPNEGGHVVFMGTDLGTSISLDDTVRFWTVRDSCPETPAISSLPDTSPRDGTRVSVEQYAPCGDGSTVVVYRVDGGGHTWPGGQEILPESLVGRTSRDIDANEVIWAFFFKNEERIDLTSAYFEYIPGPGAAGISVQNGTAYVTTSDGVRIYDVSDSRKPSLLATYAAVTDAADIALVGQYAYLARGKMQSGVGHLTIVNINDPANPTHVGDVELPHGTVSVVVKDDYAYLGGYDAGVFVVDIRDRSSPQHVYTITFPRIDNPKQDEIPGGRALCALSSKRDAFPCQLGRSWWLHIDGDLLYVNDENTGLHILELANAARPVEVAHLLYPLMEGQDNLTHDAYNDIAVEGERGYIAMDNGGILIIDLTDIRNPTPLYHYAPWEGYTWADSPGHMAQIASAEGIVFATAGEAGVVVLDARDPRAPSLRANYPLRSDVGASWGIFLDENTLYITYIAVDPGNSALERGGWEILKIGVGE